MNIYLTPNFIEQQRQKGIMNTVLADFISKKDPETASQVQMVRQKYGKDNDDAMRSYLDWKVYGTSQPADRFKPEEQSIEPQVINGANPRNLPNPVMVDKIQEGVGDQFTKGVESARKFGQDLMSGNFKDLGADAASTLGHAASTVAAPIAVPIEEKFGEIVTSVVDLAKAIGKSPNFQNSKLNSPALKSVVSNFMKDAGTLYEELQKAAPAQIEAAGAVTKGAFDFTAAGQAHKIIGKTVQTVENVGKSTVDKAAAIKEALPVAKASTSDSAKGIQQLALPKANKKEIFKAAREGRVIENRAGEPTAITPNARQQEIASAMELSGVTDKMKPTQATKAVQKSISESGDLIEKHIAESNFAFNDKEAVGVFNRALQEAKNNAIITTKSEEATFKKIGELYFQKFKAISDTPIDEIVPGTNIKGAGGNRALAWYRARKAMDNIAPSKTFTGDSVMNAKVNAFSAYRDAANEFLSTNLEAGKSAYAPTMRYMSNLFRGLDALETNIPKNLAPSDMAKILNYAKKVGIGIAGYTALKKLTPVGEFLP